jgi:hypothetical protein
MALAAMKRLGTGAEWMTKRARKYDDKIWKTDGLDLIPENTLF